MKKLFLNEFKVVFLFSTVKLQVNFLVFTQDR